MVETDELGAHLHAQRGVEVGERLVHRETPVGSRIDAPARAPRAGAGRRRALTGTCASAGERSGVEDAGRPRASAGLESAAWGSLRSRRSKGEVLVHAHVRVEGVALEDQRRRRASRGGRQVGHVTVADPASGPLARCHSRPASIRSAVVLPQPDGPDQHDELALADVERFKSVTTGLPSKNFQMLLATRIPLTGRPPSGRGRRSPRRERSLRRPRPPHEPPQPPQPPEQAIRVIRLPGAPSPMRGTVTRSRPFVNNYYQTYTSCWPRSSLLSVLNSE